jgi:amidase
MIPKLTDEPGALDTAAEIRSGAMSPIEAVDAAISRIEELDGPINAVVVRDFERARETAMGLDGQTPGENQPLFGVPMTVKEAFNVAGLPTTWGIPDHAGFIADKDAVVVERLKRAGAIIVGKTNVPPALSDWQSTNPIYGITGNPHDLAKSPGGSSGGSAAALAAGMVPAEFGSDIGGSIRVPAHFCGTWGHKPTWGAIDQHGHDIPGTEGHGIALAVVGPMARNAADLAVLLELTLDRRQELSGKNLAQSRFLLLTNHPATPTDNATVEALEGVAVKMEKAGARVDRKSDLLPDLAAQHAAYLPMLMTAMDPRAPGEDGAPPSLGKWYHFLNLQAANRRQWAALFDAYDFVIAPCFSTPAFPHDDLDPYRRMIAVNGQPVPAIIGLSWPGVATYPGLPATALPIGQSEGMPVGLQLISAEWRDCDCVAMAGDVAALIDD